MKAEVIGVCSALGSLYLAMSLVSYQKWDPSLFTFSSKPASNYGGTVGAYVSDTLISSIGIASYALPVFLLVYGVKSLLGKEKHRVHLVGALLFVLSASLLSSLMVSTFGLEAGAGGVVGHYGGMLLVNGLSVVGAYIVTIAAFLSALILLSPVSFIYVLLNPKGKKPKTKKPGKAGEPEAEDMDFSMPLVVEPPLEVVVPPGSGGARAAGMEADGVYELPGIDLLSAYEPVERPSKDDLLVGSAVLERKLADFSVQGRVTQVHTGPVVTMYEFEPAPGVKINRVVSLSDDLALAIKAQSIRIATLHGKAAIGIEIPNQYRETVSLRDTLASESFSRSKSRLTIALGKDIFGAPVVADLARMPHLLVAGATGAGKSVALNAMVISLLYKARPDELKILMIDPKLLEFSVYEGIPHLVSPVVTNPKEAAEMLRKMVFEMERRYRLIAEKGVRNIESFNAAAAPGEKLPYIVIIIDELADLMFASASQVEDSIARLAQMARASGIHLILATQRPSVDVITGVIKANFPARMAFQVTSRIDSRTILDAQGAEQLIGRGDMLFMLPGVRIMRVHGALVTEAEVRQVVDFVKGQAEPDYGIVEEIGRVEAEAAAEEEYSEDRDEMYRKALQFAESVGEVSISSIQRRLKVGYNRAARIMDLMEEDGLVGPPRGAGKPRDYLGRKNF
jgi:S-DNA-T family DNA segregation ATPase FtsK/SpoIIIE